MTISEDIRVTELLDKIASIDKQIKALFEERKRLEDHMKQLLNTELEQGSKKRRADNS